jgi:hypothetical protein
MQDGPGDSFITFSCAALRRIFESFMEIQDFRAFGVKGGLGGLGDQSRKGLIRGGTWRIFRAAEVIARSYVYPITFLRLSQADVG